MTRAQRDTAVERYEQLLVMAEVLADGIDEMAHGGSPTAPGRRAALAALEPASEVCSRLGSIVRSVREMAVER